MAGTLCNFATQLKFLFGYDDCLDVCRLYGCMLCILPGDGADTLLLSLCRSSPRTALAV